MNVHILRQPGLAWCSRRSSRGECQPDLFSGRYVGLAIRRKIVERHAGTITAKSKPGQGATFIIMLPLEHKVEDA